jgi:hypothetical protein
MAAFQQKDVFARERCLSIAVTQSKKGSVSYEIPCLRLRHLLCGGILLDRLAVRGDRERLLSFSAADGRAVRPGDHQQRSIEDAQDALTVLIAIAVGLGGLVCYALI